MKLDTVYQGEPIERCLRKHDAPFENDVKSRFKTLQAPEPQGAWR
jgi:hypothetical protein